MMKTKLNQTISFVVAGAMLVSSVGCASMPWPGQKQAAISNGQNMDQVASNIEYNTTADYTQNYQAYPGSATSYTSPPSISAAPSGGESESCSSGCCK